MMDNDLSSLVCDVELDANGLSCSLPLLRAKLELNRLPSGGALRVIATDAGSQRDFRTFAQLAGHELLYGEATEGAYQYWLCKRQRSLRRSDSGFPVIKVLRDWMQRYSSDEKAVVLVIMLVLGFSATFTFGGMLVSVLVAMVIAFLTQDVVGILEHLQVPYLLAVWLVYSPFLGLLALFLTVLLPLFWQQLSTLSNEPLRMLGEWQSVLLMLPEYYPSLVSEEQVLKAIEIVRGKFSQIGQWASISLLTSPPVVVSVMIYLVLVPILVFFFLKGKKCFRTWFHHYLPHERGLTKQAWAEMSQQIANYIRGKVIEIAITGTMTYIVFVYLGLNHTAPLALLVGLSVVVPYIGTVVVSVSVVTTAFFQWDRSDQFIYLMVARAIIQALDGNVLAPLLFSGAVNLHPVAIICTVLLFGELQGFWGVLFAIPLVILVKAVLDVWPKDPPKTPAITR